MRYKVKMVNNTEDGFVAEKEIKESKKQNLNFNMSLSKEDLLHMKKKAGLVGEVTSQQIVNAYLRTMINQY